MVGLSWRAIVGLIPALRACGGNGLQIRLLCWNIDSGPILGRWRANILVRMMFPELCGVISILLQ